LSQPSNPDRAFNYVLAFVPEGASNRFFVLTQDEVNAEIAADSEIARQRAAATGRTTTEDFTGISFPAAEKYENAWKKLPA
jgi:hypothetical protein